MKRKIILGCCGVLMLLLIGAGWIAYLIFSQVEGAYFDSNGVRIHYTDEGKGDPVILIHGVGANSDLNWRRPGIIRLLAKNFRVISYDLRGHGLSDKPTDPEKYGVEMVEDTIRLMDHLGIEEAQVAGYSLGGFILLKLATTHPERLKSAVFCAAGWKNPEDPSEIPNPYQSPPPIVEEKPKVALASAAPDTKGWFKRVRSWVGDHIGNKAARKALKKSYMALAVSREALQNNHLPALCIIGTQDGFLRLAEDLKKNMTDLELVEVDGPGHFSLPFNAEFKKQLNNFLMAHQ